MPAFTKMHGPWSLGWFKKNMTALAPECDRKGQETGVMTGTTTDTHLHSTHTVTALGTARQWFGQVSQDALCP